MSRTTIVGTGSILLFSKEQCGPLCHGSTLVEITLKSIREWGLGSSARRALHYDDHGHDAVYGGAILSNNNNHQIKYNNSSSDRFIESERGEKTRDAVTTATRNNKGCR